MAAARRHRLARMPVGEGARARHVIGTVGSQGEGPNLAPRQRLRSTSILYNDEDFGRAASSKISRNELCDVVYDWRRQDHISRFAVPCLKPARHVREFR